MKNTPRQPTTKRFFKLLGPGLITGAADDDPSGIATYSIAGASLGFATLWTIVPISLVIVALQFWGSYRMISQVLKWLILTLFAYVAAAFLARPDWTNVLKATFPLTSLATQPI